MPNTTPAPTPFYTDERNYVRGNGLFALLATLDGIDPAKRLSLMDAASAAIDEAFHRGQLCERFVRQA